jgi:hypothetical protein
MPVNTLDELAVKHQSDKALLLPGRNGHGYASHYDLFFSGMRDKPIRLLEIGVDKGPSIRMWSEYFPKAEIVGIDINPECLQVTGNFKVVIGDQSSPLFWLQFVTEHGSQWDIIIDDGGHYANMIITSFEFMWEHVRRGGFYCVEDMGTAYPNYIQGRIRCDEVYLQNCVPSGWRNHMDYFKDKIDELNLGNEIEIAYFSKELVLLKK